MLLEFLKRNNKIIVNTDIDGILSGVILCRFAGCKVVGFSNSSNKVLYDKEIIASPYDGVYIDMFVPREDVMCLDQHIIAYNQEHNLILNNNKNKINPNLERGRTFIDTYKTKFPFATTQYIVSLLEADGIDVTLPDMNQKLFGGVINFGDLYLRADNTLRITLIDYPKNAIDWWMWMVKRSKYGKTTSNTLDYIIHTDSNKIESKNKFMADYFKNNYKCDSDDGGYEDIIGPDHLYKDGFINYIEFIQKLLGFNDLFLPPHRLTSSYGLTRRIEITPEQADTLIHNNKINGKEVFSYGFVTQKKISYTMDLIVN